MGDDDDRREAEEARASLQRLIEGAVPVVLDPDAPPRQPYPPLADEAPRGWLEWLFPRHRKS